MANSVKNARFTDILFHFRYKLDYQTAEAIMIQSLYKELPSNYNFDDECTRHKWIIHKYPGHFNKLTNETLLSERRRR